MSISLTNGGEWIFAGENHFDFPLNFSIGGSTSLVGDVMSTGDYLPWVSVDELLVKSLGLTKAYDTFQSYNWLQIFMIAFPDTFIIDSSTGRDRQWQGTWRVGRPRPLDRSLDCIHQDRGGSSGADN